MVDETKIDGISVYEIYMNISLKDMTCERWKDIACYEGYQISNLGRLKSLERVKLAKSGCFAKVKERILKQVKNKGGYLRVKLCKDGKEKSFLVHCLVAKAFVPNPENKPQVNHISETLYDDKNKHLAKQDNRAVNIEWCDRKYNVNYGTRNERISKKMINNEKTSKQVLCIETNIVYPSISEAKRQTCISRGNIYACCNRKRKTAGGFHWKYIE